MDFSYRMVLWINARLSIQLKQYQMMSKLLKRLNTFKNGKTNHLYDWLHYQLITQTYEEEVYDNSKGIHFNFDAKYEVKGGAQSSSLLELHIHHNM